jgi:serine phosphatase RsbU (regulator of sigma subunit)
MRILTPQTPERRRVPVARRDFSSAGPVVRYGGAIASVAVATLLAYVIQPLNGPSAFLLYFAAVSISSWFGRLGPTLVAIVLSLLALDIFFLPPVWALGMSVTDAVGVGVFVLLAILMNSLHWRQRRLELVIATNQHEIQTAHWIQQKLFPTVVPHLIGFDIAGACYPANATGGDYFDFIPMLDGRLGVAIGDVNGHGFGPALLMAETHAFLRALALVNADVGAVLTTANRLVCEDTRGEQFITLFLACLDPRSRSFVYASAGHEGYHLDRAGKVTKLESTGMALGVEEAETIETGPSMKLDGDEILLLMTDGVCEARAPDGAPFGLARALDAVRKNRSHTAQQILNALCRDVQEHSKGLPQEDDITLIVIKSWSADS